MCLVLGFRGCRKETPPNRTHAESGTSAAFPQTGGGCAQRAPRLEPKGRTLELCCAAASTARLRSPLPFQTCSSRVSRFSFEKHPGFLLRAVAGGEASNGLDFTVRLYLCVSHPIMIQPMRFNPKFELKIQTVQKILKKSSKSCILH
jgi:hypothetical protein